MDDSGNGLLRVTWVLVAIGCVLGGLILASGVDLLPFLPFVAWPLSVVSLVMALIMACRYWRNTSPPRQRRRTILVAVTVLAAGVVVVGHTILIPMVWKAAQDYHKALATWANLRGLDLAVSDYCDDHNDYPQSLDKLVESGLITPKQLLSFLDPGIFNPNWQQDKFRSFVYCPGVGAYRDEPDVILAWEREAWSPLELRLFPKRGRWVLFGDGTVRRVGANDFAAAQQRDKETRAELGWPMCEK